MKKIIIVTLLLAVLLCFSSCDSLITPYDFTQNGLSITLDTSFTRNQTVKGYTASYRSAITTVYLLREAFDEAEDDVLTEDLTLDDYALLVLTANGQEGKTVEEHGTYLSFSYEVPLNDSALVYEVYLYKMSDAFWIVQFVCDKAYYENQKPSFAVWASSVKDTKAESEKTQG